MEEKCSKNGAKIDEKCSKNGDKSSKNGAKMEPPSLFNLLTLCLQDSCLSIEQPKWLHVAILLPATDNCGTPNFANGFITRHS
jgi:hypothetical protein